MALKPKGPAHLLPLLLRVLSSLSSHVLSLLLSGPTSCLVLCFRNKLYHQYQSTPHLCLFPLPAVPSTPIKSPFHLCHHQNWTRPISSTSQFFSSRPEAMSFSSGHLMYSCYYTTCRRLSPHLDISATSIPARSPSPGRYSPTEHTCQVASIVSL